MTLWKGPTFIKKTVNGKQIQIYKFILESQLDQFTIIGTSTSKLSELVTESTWIPLLNEFIQTFGRLFNKPITAEYIYKSAIDIKNPECNEVGEEVEWTLYSISIDSGKFIFQWNCSAISPISLDIDEEIPIDKELPLESVPLNDIDIDNIADIIEPKSLKPRNASYLHREKARQRVKELRLNARLSYFRAKQEQRKFEERFGSYESEYPTDDSSEDTSLWSESDSD